MRYFHRLLIAAVIFFGSPALAQWQIPNHSTPIGKGAGVTGFGSVGPCNAGVPILGAGSSADPACSTTFNATSYTFSGLPTFTNSTNAAIFNGGQVQLFQNAAPDLLILLGRTGSAGHSDPVITLINRDNVTPSGAGGSIYWDSPNSIGANKSGALINAGLITATAGAEMGTFELHVLNNGVDNNAFQVNAYFGAPAWFSGVTGWSLGLSGFPFLNGYFSGGSVFVTNASTSGVQINSGSVSSNASIGVGRVSQNEGLLGVVGTAGSGFSGSATGDIFIAAAVAGKSVLIGNSVGAPLPGIKVFSDNTLAFQQYTAANGVLHAAITTGAITSSAVVSADLNITGTTCTNQFVRAISSTAAGTCATVSLTADVSGDLPLANGGTNANLTASNGGIFYSTATAGAILAGTATAGQMLRSGASAAPSWSTTTWPATTTINRLLWSSAANVISDLATANSSVLVTDSSGVPSLSSVLPTITGDLTVAKATAKIVINATGGTTAATEWQNAGTTKWFFNSVAGASDLLVLVDATATNGITIAQGGGMNITKSVWVGAPTGTDKGAGTINVQTGYYANGTVGVTCGAGLGASSRTTLGLVTTC